MTITNINAPSIFLMHINFIKATDKLANIQLHIVHQQILNFE